MEKPIVLVWREVLASDVIKAHILETGAAPDLQDREVQVELTELTKDTRVMLAGCLMDGWSPNVGLVVEPLSYSSPRSLCLTGGPVHLPTRTVREWPSAEKDREDAVRYASEQIGKALAAVGADEKAAQAQRFRDALAAWVGRHGTDDQRERLAAGVLPDEEVEQEAKRRALALIVDLPAYERITFSDIPHLETCVPDESDEDEETYGAGGQDNLTTSTEDYEQSALPTMSAGLWERFSSLVKTLPAEASWTLRRHTVTCDDCDASVTRWSMLVRLPTELPGVVASRRIAV